MRDPHRPLPQPPSSKEAGSVSCGRSDGRECEDGPRPRRDGRRGGPWRRLAGVWHAGFWLAGSWLALLLPLAALAPRAAAESPATFIFVLDGSGSMDKARVPDGRTRWEAAKASIASTIESLPDGFDAEILVFGSKVEPSRWSNRWSMRSRQERAAAVAFARSPSERGGRAWSPGIEGTALYDAMGWAFSRAEEICRNGGQVTIVVLSDGDDQNSRIWSPDGDGGRRRSLCDALGLLRRTCLAGLTYRFSRTSRDLVPPCDPDAIGESIVFTTLPIVAKPEGPTEFASLADGPQRIALRIEVPPNFSIAGLASMDVRFVPEPGQPAVRLEPSQIRLENGAVPLSATVVGPAPDTPVRGTLRFVVGKPKAATAIVMPPRDIPIGFAAPAKVSLDPGQVLPADGAVFLKGRPIRFAAPEVAGGTAAWQFGDGESGTGFTASHAYASEGVKTFTLSVTKPGSQAFSLSRRLRVVDISVAIVPPSTLPIAGEEIALEARTTGPVKAIRWQIDSFDVAAASDGRLRYRFASPGTYEARAIAVTDFGDFDARLPITIGEGASIAIVRPDSDIAALVPITFRAVVTGPVAEVRWSVVGADGTSHDLGIAGGLDRVEPIGQDRVSEFTATLPAAAAGRVTLTATAVLPAELIGRIDSLEDSVERTVLPPGLFTTIASPIAGETLAFDRETAFTAQLAGSGLAEVTAVKWRFLDAGGAEIGTIESSIERAPDRPEGTSRVVFTPLAEHGPQLRVEASPIGAARTEPGTASFGVRLLLPPYELWCGDAASGIAPLGRNLKFEVRPATHLEEVRFDFGDGGNETVAAGAAAAFHRFATGGLFDVRAVATTTDGRSIDLGPLRLLVEAAAPTASLRATLRGESLADAAMVNGGTIAIADESTGDIVERRWMLTGPIDSAGDPGNAPTRVLESGAESVVIDQAAYGTYLLRLEVVGTPDRPGAAAPTDAAEIAFENRRPRDWTLSILAASIGGFLTVVAFWFVAGQYPRKWRVTLAATSTDDPQWELALERGVSTRPGRRGPLGGWSWLRKRGEMSVDRMLARAHPELHQLLAQGDPPTSLGTLVIERGSEPLRLQSMVFEPKRLRQHRNTIVYAIVLDHAMRSEEIGRAVGGTPKILVEVRRDPTSMWSDAPLLLLPIIALAATVSISIWAFLQAG